MALRTEVKLARNTQGQWTFTVHKHPMRDSGLGQVITKLLGYHVTFLPVGRCLKPRPGVDAASVT
jgi:hypothetical protein